uniref:Uncharacterized protein n=1 Tax=Fibrocapsa japonica TaxID=94617 RepID=A0A7S2USC0_9STRA
MLKDYHQSGLGKDRDSAGAIAFFMGLGAVLILTGILLQLRDLHRSGYTLVNREDNLNLNFIDLNREDHLTMENEALEHESECESDYIEEIWHDVAEEERSLLMWF